MTAASKQHIDNGVVFFIIYISEFVDTIIDVFSFYFVFCLLLCCMVAKKKLNFESHQDMAIISKTSSRLKRKPILVNDFIALVSFRKQIINKYPKFWNWADFFRHFNSKLLLQGILHFYAVKELLIYDQRGRPNKKYRTYVTWGAGQFPLTPRRLFVCLLIYLLFLLCVNDSEYTQISAVYKKPIAKLTQPIYQDVLVSQTKTKHLWIYCPNQESLLINTKYCLLQLKKTILNR